jgi:hypothetical protein
MELFKKQRLVSFSFFVNTDKFQGAAISDWSKHSPKYQLHLKPYLGPIGWVDVRVVPKNSTLDRGFVGWFNEAMREETNIHAFWRHGSYDWEAGETPIGEKVRPSFIKVKVTAVYLVSSRGDRVGAEEALSCLKSGTGNVLEWYDATPEGRWKALMKPNISFDTIVVPPVSARQ